MRDLSILFTQARYQLLTATRNSRVIVFGVVFPVFLLVLFNSIFATGDNQTTTFAGGRIDTQAYFTAGMAAYAITLQTFTQIVIGVTTQRESGQLKRLRGTPMPAWTFIGSYVVRSIALVALMVAVLFGIGVIAFGVELHAAGVLGIIVYTALGTAAMTTLGMAVTVFTPTTDVASSVGPFSAVILSFISGVFIPVETLPNWLESVGKVFPLYHLAEGLQRCVGIGATGTGLTAGNVAVLSAWGLGGLVVAARRFHWEPQAAAA